MRQKEQNKNTCHNLAIFQVIVLTIMIKYKTKKEIIEILNDKMFMDFDYNKRTTKPLTDNDIYIIKGWIFVNMTPTKSVYKYTGIDVYKYPLNEYCLFCLKTYLDNIREIFPMTSYFQCHKLA